MKKFNDFMTEETVSGDISTTGNGFGFTNEYLKKLVLQEFQSGELSNFDDFVKKHKIPPEKIKDLRIIFRSFYD